MNVVLSVLHHLDYGGPHNQLLRLHRPLLTQGWETVVVLPEGPGDGAARLRNGGIKVIQVPLHRPRKTLRPRPHLELLFGFPSEISMLQQIIRERQASIVQVFGVMYPHGAVAAHFLHVPVVWQLLGTFAPHLIRSLLMPAVVRLSAVVMTTGNEVARAHPGAQQLGNRLVIFHPPVDTKEFRPDPVRRAQARRELGIPTDGVLIGTVGNFNRLKGHDVFVQAASHVLEHFPHAFFRILGVKSQSQSSYYDEHVKKLAENLQLFRNNRMQFVEPGGRVSELLPAFDLFVLTSRAEGVPTVILEAMSCGVPVLAVKVGAVHEVVEEGVTGRIIASHNSRIVANNILGLIENPFECSRMGAAGRAIAVEHYDIRVCVDRHLAAYEMARKEFRANGFERFGENATFKSPAKLEWTPEASETTAERKSQSTIGRTQ